MIGRTAPGGASVAGLGLRHAALIILSDGPSFVTVQLIAVDREMKPIRRAKVFLALVAAVRHWAASLNAGACFVRVTTGQALPATDRLLRAAGARMIGGAYAV